MRLMREAVLELGADKAPRPKRFPLAFFQFIWEDTKYVMAFTKEFYKRRLSKQLGAFCIALIHTAGAVNIKDFGPTSLTGSVYKIIAKVMASRFLMVLPSIISHNHSASVNGR